MAFEDRLTQASILVNIIEARIWQLLSPRITVMPFGYETHVPDRVRQQMRFLRTITSKFVRFMPDFFLIDQSQPEHMYLLEYKTTQTPRYSQKWITRIGREAGIPNLRGQDIGQMEADAYDNYRLIQSIGVRVVILNYCAYHERLLLCDYVENINILHHDEVTTQTLQGSRTPYVNFDCNSMRSLDEFILQEHNLAVGKETYNTTRQELANRLPIKHNPNSPFRSSG